MRSILSPQGIKFSDPLRGSISFLRLKVNDDLSGGIAGGSGMGKNPLWAGIHQKKALPEQGLGFDQD
jgi:hypothetical protein